MNNLEKDFISDDGSEKKMIAVSNDNEPVKMAKGVTLANHQKKKENALVKRFKGSILGSDVGIKSGGFSSVAGLAIVLVLAALAVMYFLWRF